MGTHILGIKDMAGLCKPYAAHALVKALRDEVGRADPLPHARHQRHQRRHRSCAPPTRAWTSPTRALASMSGHDQPAEPQLDRRRAASTRRATPALDLDALNRLSDYWEAVREFYYPFEEGLKSADGRGLPARDARRAVHQPPASRPRAWAWRTAGTRSPTRTPRSTSCSATS